MEDESKPYLDWKDFMNVEMRVGTIVEAETFTAAKQPAYKIKIDFGAFGIRKTSAQITRCYAVDELIGQQVIAVVNFPPKQIATMMSECLLLGAIGDEKEVVLIQPERKIENGLRIG
ncbi:MAG: tRNA-binding protein [Bacteroidota bacterium]